MTAFNVSADDSSPLISYSPAGAWTDSPMNDISAQSYSQKTWHTASSQGASATIQFDGTGIWFFGAKRPDYGTYNIFVDGQSVSGNAQSQTASFQQLLGGQSGLANGPHTAVFTNTGSGSAVDLDTIIFETQIGSASATVANTTTDDISPAINYLPSSGDWVLLTSLEGNFNNTLHFTQSRGAQAQFTFDGDAVAIYGTVSPAHANYSVTVDGIKRDFLGGSNGLASALHEGTLLYFSNNLAPQSHNLTLTANLDQPDTGKFMDIDRIVVFTAPDGTDSTPSNNQSDPSSTAQNPEGNSANNVGDDQKGSHPSKRLSPVVIGALVAGILILMLLLLIVLAVVFVRRWRRRAQQNKTHPRSSVGTPMTPNLPIQTPSTPDFSPLSPTGFELQNPFSDPSNLEKGSTPPLSAVRSALDVNSFAGNVETMSPAAPKTSVMQGSRDDRQAGELQDQSSVSGALDRSLRPPALKLAPGLGG